MFFLFIFLYFIPYEQCNCTSKKQIYKYILLTNGVDLSGLDWTGVDWSGLQSSGFSSNICIWSESMEWTGLEWTGLHSNGGFSPNILFWVRVHMDYGGDSKVLSGSIDPLLSDCFLASNGEGRNLSSFGGVGGEGR